jgi:hypothetical protein
MSLNQHSSQEINGNIIFQEDSIKTGNNNKQIMCKTTIALHENTCIVKYSRDSNFRSNFTIFNLPTMTKQNDTWTGERNDVTIKIKLKNITVYKGDNKYIFNLLNRPDNPLEIREKKNGQRTEPTVIRSEISWRFDFEGIMNTYTIGNVTKAETDIQNLSTENMHLLEEDKPFSGPGGFNSIKSNIEDKIRDFINLLNNAEWKNGHRSNTITPIHANFFVSSLMGIDMSSFSINNTQNHKLQVTIGNNSLTIIYNPDSEIYTYNGISCIIIDNYYCFITDMGIIFRNLNNNKQYHILEPYRLNKIIDILNGNDLIEILHTQNIYTYFDTRDNPKFELLDFIQIFKFIEIKTDDDRYNMLIEQYKKANKSTREKLRADYKKYLTHSVQKNNLTLKDEWITELDSEFIKYDFPGNNEIEVLARQAKQQYIFQKSTDLMMHDEILKRFKYDEDGESFSIGELFGKVFIIFLCLVLVYFCIPTEDEKNNTQYHNLISTK